MPQVTIKRIMVWIGGLGLLLGICIPISRGEEWVIPFLKFYASMSFIALLWLPIVMVAAPKTRAISFGLSSALLAVSGLLLAIDPLRRAGKGPGTFSTELAFAGSIFWLLATLISLFLAWMFCAIRELIRGVGREWSDRDAARR